MELKRDFNTDVPFKWLHLVRENQEGVFVAATDNKGGR